MKEWPMSMFTGTYPHLMAEYNRWMNGKIYAACAELPDAERRKDRGAFFKSITATLNHILWGDRIWLGRFNGQSYPVGAVNEELHADFAELRAAREAFDQEILDWARGVTPAWLQEPLSWTSRLYGFTQTQPRWVLVVQLFNHQTHHRGQVHAMLTQLGMDVGPTDVPVLPLLNAAV
jgi:uncharacterized damage-inducible protein DinB